MKKLDDGIPTYKQFDQHLWADYIEMLCCWDIDHEISKANFIDIIRPNEEDILVDEFPRDSSAIEDDKYTARTDELYKFFKLRSNIYGDNYPFISDHGVLRLKDKFLNSSAHLLYIYLLCCSKLEFFKNEKEFSIFTSEFEEISRLAAKNILPENAVIHLCGKNALGGEPKYKGSLYKKLSEIAKDLGEELRVKPDDFAPTNSGDGGLDLIGWINFNDKLNSQILFTGQSKCNVDWDSNKTAGDMLDTYMNLNNPPSDLYFIPYCFRRLSYDWHESYKVKKMVLLDRARIIGSLKGSIEEFVKKSNSISLIKELLKQPSEII